MPWDFDVFCLEFLIKKEDSWESSSVKEQSLGSRSCSRSLGLLRLGFPLKED